MTPARRWLLLSSALLFFGTVFAWSKLFPQFATFYREYGTLLRFANCTIPNPLTTACLYGSLAFLVALFWSVRVYLDPYPRSIRLLRNFLIFCALFAGTVVLSEMAEFYHWIATPISVTCSPGVAPVNTPCFTGMLFFIAAALGSFFAVRAGSITK